MADRPSLEIYLQDVPEECRYRLDRKIDERSSLVKIARSIRNWEVVANFLPGVGDHDVAAIKHDHSSSLEVQQ